MSPNSSTSANRHSLWRGEHKAILQKQNARSHLLKDHMQRQLLPTGLAFQSSVETLPNPLYEVQKRVHHRLVLLRLLTVHNIIHSAASI